MKSYHFRLTPVLKLRKIREETCRTELGKLVAELNRIEDQLNYDRNEILKYYAFYEGTLQREVAASKIQSFPMMIRGKERNIELLINAKDRQEKLIQEKKSELAILKGELKVIEKLKEKDFEEYRKTSMKELDLKIEEQTQLWLNGESAEEEL